jgi:hypothetical protein
MADHVRKTNTERIKLSAAEEVVIRTSENGENK